MSRLKTILASGTLALAALSAPVAALASTSAPAAHNVKAVPASCNTSMTGEAFPRNGDPYSQVIVDTNSCNRQLESVSVCGPNWVPKYGGAVTGVGHVSIAFCGNGVTLDESGCREHYSTGWSVNIYKWVQGNPNPYSCP